MRGAIRIVDRTKKFDVDSRLPLKSYYRTADDLLKQARIYRDEENSIEYYILLLRFSSLVSETIPDHRDYRLYARERKDYMKRLLDVIAELEKLKPKVQKQVDEYNRAFLKSTSVPSKSSPSSFNAPYNTPSSYNSTLQLDSGATRPPFSSNQPFSGVSNYEKFGDQGNRAHVPGYSDSGPGCNPASTSHVKTHLDDQFKTFLEGFQHGDQLSSFEENRRMRKPSGSSRSQDEDPFYQLDFQDLTLNPNFLRASLPTRSTEARFPGTKFVVVTEAQEITLQSLGINLRPRSFTKDCDICTDTFPLSAFMSTKGCPHEYCLNCCKRHAEAKLTSGSLQMECPDPSCVHSFTMDQCRTLLSESNFTTLNIRLTETAIPASLRVYCPFKDCSVFMEKSESGGTFAECYFCHRLFCQACNVPWHNNQTCGEYRAKEMNSRLSGDQKLRELAKQQKWQTCPDCKSFVERTEGCKHMTCVCKIEFCYLCGKKYINKSAGCKC